MHDSNTHNSAAAQVILEYGSAFGFQIPSNSGSRLRRTIHGIVVRHVYRNNYRPVRPAFARPASRLEAF
jgi:hypothetical protein